MRIDIGRAAELLRENDDILVLCHAHPDGDTLGCGYALMHMLQSLGKRCRLECADEIAPKYSFMTKGLEIFGDFEPKFITAVDVADIKLLSDESAEKYSGRVDLCIDHHGSNSEYAKEFCVDSTAAACAEILCPLADELGVGITPAIATVYIPAFQRTRAASNSRTRLPARIYWPQGSWSAARRYPR